MAWKKIEARAAERSGFTLIEMSIVLVIIALIAGGIIAGQALIRSSQLMSVIADEKKYAIAVRQFREKYNALPGDMPNATSYWGSNTDTGYGCGSWYSTITSSTSTCNGDGNGIMNGGDGNSAYQRDEQFFLWRHLANAGFIQGNFTGKDMGAYSSAATGINVPASRIPNGGYVVISNNDVWYPGGGTWIYPWSELSNIVVFGSNYNGDNSEFGAVITAAEALNIDSKIDDGKPGKGYVRSPRTGSTQWGTTNCADNYDPNLANYKVSASGNVCSLMFEFQ